MLASSAHVKLGTYEYILDEGVPEHYVHEFEYPVAEEVEIQGEPGTKTIRRKRLFWSMTDWTGGEGARNWSEDEPNVYGYGTVVNTRIPGQFTGRPKRVSKTVNASTDDGDLPPKLAIAKGGLWVAGGEKTQSTDNYGVTWTNQANNVNAGDKIYSVAGDDSWLYVASGGSGALEVHRLDRSGTQRVIDRNTSAPNARPYHGMAIMGGRLYGWTGAKLWEMDVGEIDSATDPLVINDTYRKVYDSGIDLDFANFGGSSPGSWWADCVATENSVLMFLGSEGITNVYEYKKGRGYPLWRLPYGFTAKTLTVQNSIAYVTGYYPGDGTTKGYGAIYAMPLKTRQETFVGWVRKVQDENHTLNSACNSWGYQIMFAQDNAGKIYVYDAETDGISMLDQYDNKYDPQAWIDGGGYKISEMKTFGNKRYVLFYTPGVANGDDYYVQIYENDEPDSRSVAAGINNAGTASGSLSDFLESPYHNFNFPMDAKNLIGFHVTYKVENTGTISGLKANQRITVSYSLDDAAYVDTTVITSATTPTDVQGRVFVPVATGSGQAKFYRMKVKVTIDNNSTTTVQQPIVLGVVTEAELLPRNETWELIIRSKDEPNTNARPVNRKYLGSQLRDYLEDLVQNKSVITFLDGYRYKQPKTYTTHSVTVEDWKDVIEKAGEGSIRVSLRSVNNS